MFGEEEKNVRELTIDKKEKRNNNMSKTLGKGENMRLY